MLTLFHFHSRTSTESLNRRQKRLSGKAKTDIFPDQKWVLSLSLSLPFLSYFPFILSVFLRSVPSLFLSRFKLVSKFLTWNVTSGCCSWCAGWLTWHHLQSLSYCLFCQWKTWSLWTKTSLHPSSFSFSFSSFHLSLFLSLPVFLSNEREEKKQMTLVMGLGSFCLPLIMDLSLSLSLLTCFLLCFSLSLFWFKPGIVFMVTRHQSMERGEQNERQREGKKLSKEMGERGTTFMSFPMSFCSLTRPI